MRLYNETSTRDVPVRPERIISFTCEEKLERKKYVFKSERDRGKFIKTCEKYCRKSPEYRELIKMLKKNGDMTKCTVLKKIKTGGGRKYSIEIHHHPFTLYDICAIVLLKREELGEKICPIAIADEVMELHYSEKVGLIPLSKTMHELYHDGQIFIPLQFVYQKYDVFAQEYGAWIDLHQKCKDKIELMIEMSQRCANVLSDALDVEFTYLDVDGFTFPALPEEWGNIMKSLDEE